MIAQKPLPRSKFASVAERLFFGRYTGDVREIAFGNADVAAAAGDLGYAVTDQLSNFFEAFAFQQPLPPSIRTTAPRDFEWRIMNEAPNRYRFALRTRFHIVPDSMLSKCKVNDVTAGDRQPCNKMGKRELLNFAHANRLVEQFTGLRCVSREIDVRIEVPLEAGTTKIMQLVIDDVVYGENRRGSRYVIPIYCSLEAEPLDLKIVEVCFNTLRERYPEYACLPLVVQGIDENTIGLFSLAVACDGVRKDNERHFMLINGALSSDKV